MNTLKKIFMPVWKIITDYPVIVSALVIYIYYLLTSIDFFEHAKEKKTFLDYVLQFDSLFWMWIAAAALLQVQRYRQRQREETEERRLYQGELERQQIQNDLLNEVTALLQDNINNPLAIISLRTQEIRRKFETDTEILRWIDSIEAAMKRIELTIRDLKGYETQKMIDTTVAHLRKNHSTRS